MTTILNVVSAWSNWLELKERERRTRRELARLTDKDLADIGIARCDIDRIAKDYVAKVAA